MTEESNGSLDKRRMSSWEAFKGVFDSGVATADAVGWSGFFDDCWSSHLQVDSISIGEANTAPEPASPEGHRSARKHRSCRWTVGRMLR